MEPLAPVEWTGVCETGKPFDCSHACMYLLSSPKKKKFNSAHCVCILSVWPPAARLAACSPAASLAERALGKTAPRLPKGLRHRPAYQRWTLSPARLTHAPPNTTSGATHAHVPNLPAQKLKHLLPYFASFLASSQRHAPDSNMIRTQTPTCHWHGRPVPDVPFF